MGEEMGFLLTCLAEFLLTFRPVSNVALLIYAESNTNRLYIYILYTLESGSEVASVQILNELSNLTLYMIKY